MILVACHNIGEKTGGETSLFALVPCWSCSLLPAVVPVASKFSDVFHTHNLFCFNTFCVLALQIHVACGVLSLHLYDSIEQAAMAEHQQARAILFASPVFGFEVVKRMLLVAFNSAHKTLLGWRNAILQRVFYPGLPLDILTLLFTVLFCCWILRLRWWQSIVALVHMLTGLPYLLSQLTLIFVTVRVSVLAPQYMLKALLTYKGYLYAPHGKTPLRVRAWSILVRLISGPLRPGQYRFQASLPSLPVPALKDTCDRYLKTMRPLQDDETHERVRRLAAEFESGLGRRLQRYATLKSWFSTNYVSDWWETYVYLRGRDPIMINSNYYILDGFRQATNVQAARAGTVLHFLTQAKIDFELERISPTLVNGFIPVCMNQYKRVFGTARVPGVEVDNIVHVSARTSRHVAVLRHGRYYQVPLYCRGKLLGRAEFEMLIQLIIDDDMAVVDVPTAELHLPALTADNRTHWANVRESLMTDEVNRRSIEIVESAAFFLVLEDDAPPFTANNDMEVRGRGEECESY